MAKNEFQITGLKRSGNHILIVWILSSFKNKRIYLNCCEPQKNPFKNYRTKIYHESSYKKAKVIIFNFEDCFIEEVYPNNNYNYYQKFIGKSDNIKRIVILRSAENVYASRIKKDYPYYLRYKFNLPQKSFLGKKIFLRLWKNNSYHGIKNKEIILVYYDKFISSKKYRDELSKKLEISPDDSVFNKIAKFGSDSSFNTNKPKVKLFKNRFKFYNKKYPIFFKKLIKNTKEFEEGIVKKNKKDLFYFISKYTSYFRFFMMKERRINLKHELIELFFGNKTDKKIILIDFIPFNWNGGKSHIFYYYNLLKKDKTVDIYILTTKYIQNIPKEKQIVIKERKNIFNLLRYKKYIVLFYALKYKFDYFISNFIYFKIPSCSEISFITDLKYLVYPDNFSKEELNFHKINVPIAIEKSDAIIVSTDSVKREIKKFFNKDSFVINVYPDLQKKNNDHKLEKTKNKYNLPEKFLFFPGEYRKNKNYELFFKALEKTKNKLNIILSGKIPDKDLDYFKQNINEISNKINIKHLGEINFDEVIEIMIMSHAIINPSYYEGCGLTKLEGISLGKKIILSDIPVNKEHTCDQTFFFKNNSIEDLAKKIDIVWGNNSPVDKVKTQEMIDRNNLKNLSKFIEVLK